MKDLKNEHEFLSELESLQIYGGTSFDDDGNTNTHCFGNCAQCDCGQPPLTYSNCGSDCDIPVVNKCKS